MNWGFRFFIIVVCYVLSIYGLVAPFLFLAGGGSAEKYALSMVSIVMMYAWLCHFVMSIAWLNQHKVKRFWPITGTVAGVASIAWLPLVDTLKNGTMISIDAVLRSIMLFGGLVLPCVLLGIYLVWFHLNRQDPINPTNR